MEEHLTDQRANIDELLRQLRNYKKDSADRKTMGYLEMKLKTIDEYWAIIENLHAKIEPFGFGDIVKTQPYFVEKTFVKTKEFYNEIRNDILQRQGKSASIDLTGEPSRVEHQSDPRAGNTNNVDNTNNDAARPNGSNGDADAAEISLDQSIGDHTNNIDVSPLDLSILHNENSFTIHPRPSQPIDELMMRYNEFMDLLQSANNLRDGSSHGRIKMQIEVLSANWHELRTTVYKQRLSGHTIGFNYNFIQEKFLSTTGRLSDLIRKVNVTEPSSKVQFSLPKLKLPEFNGNVSEWKAFISLFDRMIHENKTIDDGLKIEYLKSVVKGDAAKIINHIDPTAENYVTCYDLLCKRYENKREILGKLIDNMLRFPKMQSENAEQLKSLHDTVYESIMAIKNLGFSVNNWDPLLSHILLHKLDSATIIHYECQLQNLRETQPLKEFLAYIENRFMALLSAKTKSNNFSRPNANTNFSIKTANNKSGDEQIKCTLCEKNHWLAKCPDFEKKNVQSRIDFAKSKKLCMNCLSSQHKTSECKSQYRCKTCKKSHHSMLHIDFKPTAQANIAQANIAQVAENVMSVNSLNVQSDSTVLLATALIGVFGKNGKRIVLRALLDQGSQCAFISESAAQTLGLSRESIEASIAGIGAQCQTAKWSIKLTIFPRFESTFCLTTNAIVLPKLTRSTKQDVDVAQFELLSNLTLADPSFLKAAEIDIILGAAEYAKILKIGLIKASESMIAQNSELGWIISGSTQCMNEVQKISVVTLVSNMSLERRLNKFFDSENFEEENSDLTPEEEYCEQHFLKNYKRDNDGRFIVSLPFKNNLSMPELGDSRRCAIATQLQLEKRFKTKPLLREEYSKHIAEGIALGHVERVQYDPNNTAHYLPHHCVFKNSTTTALRVVYNASQRTSNGQSLNDQLAIGRADQIPIFELLIKFRFFQYAFTADLEKMYKQILIAEDQRDLQRFVYRNSDNEPLQDYRLRTVTFGTANAPYLAIRVTKELAHIVRENYPLAAEAILTSMYMDDVVWGCHSVDELISTYKELKAAFASGRFNIRKWCSNCVELIQIIPEEERELKAFTDNIKTLGVSWSTTNDSFTFAFNMKSNTHPNTKRKLTSEIASIYDPLGWIAPVSVSAKNLLQRLWRECRDWDTPVDENYVTQWNKIKLDLCHISSIQIPRWINYNPTDVMEMHGFCDAAEPAFAAAIYIKNVTQNTVRLLVAKARVTPIKEDKNKVNLTIPRLELCGALLLANLCKKTLGTLEIKFQKTYLWTDSQIVLGWIRGDPKRYKTFVASRISKINNVVNKENWFHVSSEDNAADCASRGMSPKELVNHDMWWHGPQFLYQDAANYKSVAQPIYDVEIQPKMIIANVAVKGFDLPDTSTFKKLNRIVAYILRFTSNCRGAERMYGALNVREIDSAKLTILRYIQNEVYAEEIKVLKNKNALSKSSRIAALSPFIDNDGILRVGGRLINADVPFDAKHQILLPHTHRITKLIIIEFHENCLHGGPKLTEATLRQSFWITNSQRTIKAMIHGCMKCFRVNPKPMTQYMGNLPENRVKATEKPFTNTAVDYTGAITIKMSSGRGAKTRKAYIAIFVCLATKAIHVEAVSDLTADAFIAAFRRFVSRRGVIRNLYSDNGTNFVKSNKILQENVDTIETYYDAKICEELTKNKTQWHFSPASAPHFNGLAEAGVKSVKLHLKKTIGESKLTFEELSTLLSQIEACVNSRPISALSSSPNDVSVLTPGHFLVGEPLIAPPEPNHIEANSNWLDKWQRVQKMSQYFWKRWQADYLNQLQGRSKWLTKNPEIPKINDLVIICEDNTPPTQWQTGRITATHPGADDLIRVVSVKTKNSELKRPITKICPLPTRNLNSVTCSRVSNKRPGVLPIITALLALLGTFPHQVPAIDTPYNVNQFNTTPGFYYEQISKAYMTYNTWQTVVFVDIKSFMNEKNVLDGDFQRIRGTCFTKLFEKGPCIALCNVVENKLKEIAEKNKLICASKARGRFRRAVLDFVGDIAGDLFGVLGSKFAKNYVKDMKQLMGNEEHIMQLLKNHTSIIDATVNILKKSDADMTNQSNNVKKLIEQFHNVTDHAQLNVNFLTLTSYLMHSIAEYENQQDALLEVLLDARQNHINLKLIPPDQMKAQTLIIANQVSEIFLTPEADDLYKITTVEPLIVDDILFFRVKIPLILPTVHQIFQIIPVPFVQNHVVVQFNTNHRFMITPIKRDQYQFMTKSELEACQHLRSDTILCSKPKHWLTTTSSDSKCEWTLLMHASIKSCTVVNISNETLWHELDEPNKWLFFTPTPTRITAFCGESVIHGDLSGSGILDLKPGCELSSNAARIVSQHDIENESNEFVFPRLTGKPMPDINVHDELISFEHIRANLSEIDETLKWVKSQQELPNKINAHDWHHYTLIYVVIFAVIAYGCIKWMRKSRSGLPENSGAPQPAPRSHVRAISMPDLA